MSKSSRLFVRVAAHEKEQIEEQAKAEGLEVSEYIRRRVLRAEAVLKIAKSVKEVQAQLSERAVTKPKRVFTDTGGERATQAASPPAKRLQCLRHHSPKAKPSATCDQRCREEWG